MDLDNLPDRISFNSEVCGFRVCKGGRGGKQTYFTFTEYGSLDKAYSAAVAYEKTLPERIRKLKKQHRKKPTERSQTGVVGVCPYHGRSEYDLGYRAFWSEDTKDGGRIHKTKDFPYNTWGRNAFHEAVKYREKKILDNGGF